MEVQPINSIQAKHAEKIVTCKKVTNPYTGNTRYIELPNISSKNYALNISVPQKYKHIMSFDIPQAGTAHFYKLQNGQKVIIVPTEGETVVKTHVNVGSMNEPDEIRGISHFIEHNLFNGSQNLKAGDFFLQTNKMGAKTNASTGFSKTDYYISTQLLEDKDLEKTIRLHADMIENPSFIIEQLEKEKGPVISEIAMVQDNDKNLAMNRAVKNLFQIQSKSTDIIAGEAQNIQNMSREDIINYYKTWYTPENMVTVITGDVDENKTIELIAKNFKKKEPSNISQSYFEKLTPIEKTVREDLISSKSPTSDIVISTAGPGSSQPKENVKVEALLTYLAGYKSAVLSSKILKMGMGNICMNIEKMSNLPSEPNAIIINTESAPDKTEKTLKLIFNTIEDIYNNPPSDEDVETVKKHMLKSYSLAIKNNAQLNNYTAQCFLNGDYTVLQKLPDIINSLTPQDIQDAALKYLNLSKASVVVSHAQNFDKEKINSSYNKTNNIVSFGASDKKNINNVINSNNLRQIILPNNAYLVLDEAKTDLSSAQILFSTKLPPHINPVAPFVLKEILMNGYEGISNENYTKNLDKQAIAIDIDVLENGLTFAVNSDKEDLGTAFENVTKIIKNPKFDEPHFKNAVSKIKNAIEGVVDTPSDLAMKEIFGEKYRHFGTKDDYLNEISKIKLSDVTSLYQYIMDNAACIASISQKDTVSVNQNSDIVKELSKMDNQFKDIEYGNIDTYTKIDGEKLITSAREQKQANIAQIYTFKISENIKDKASVDLLNMILGGNPSSRLFSDLREKQKLAYKVNSTVDKFGNTGIIKLGIQTTTEDKENNIESYDNVQKALDGFEKHVRLLKTQNVSQEELDGAKRFLKSKILEIKDSQTAKNSAIINALIKHEGLEYYNDYMQMIDEITVEDIKDAANYVFANDSVTSVVASENTIKTLNK